MSGDDSVRLYSVVELAKLWGVGETYIRDEIRAGRLPIVQLGRGDRNKARIKSADAAAWIEQHRSATIRAAS